MKRTKTFLVLGLLGVAAATVYARFHQIVVVQQPPVEALIYSTMPSRWEHRPEFAMDGDLESSFQTDGGMDDGDTFLVLLSRQIRVKSIRVTTGDSDGNDRLEEAK